MEGDAPPYAKHWNFHHVEEEYIPGDEGGSPDNLSTCGEYHGETTWNFILIPDIEIINIKVDQLRS